MTKKRRGLKITAIVLAAVILFFAVMAILPKGDNYPLENGMKKDGKLPILIAHGGGNKEFPDNTLEAFYNAYSVDERVMMETDVSITKDGVLILSHDTTLDRKTNVTGAIADWNYSDLITNRVDFGYTNKTENGQLVEGTERVHFKGEDGKEKYPTDLENYPNGIEGRDKDVFLATRLEDLLIHFPNNRINVEIKQEGELGQKALAEALRLLEKYDAFDRVVLASFHSSLYDSFNELKESGEVPEVFMYSPGTSGVVKYYVLYVLGLDVFFRDGICVFQLPDEMYGIHLDTARLVSNAHKHNIAVHYWTINDKDTMRHLIDIGADGIMTDYPHRLQEVYEEYKTNNE